MSAFSKLENKIRKKEPGLSEESARKITAKIGREKIGSHEMAKRAAASRERHEHKKESRGGEPCKMERRSDGSYSVPDTWKGDCSATGDVGRRYGPDANKDIQEKCPHTYESSEGE